jgi:hypothetical protein
VGALTFGGVSILFFFWGGTIETPAASCALAFVNAAVLLLFWGGTTETFTATCDYAFGGAFTIFFLVACVVVVSFNLKLVGKFIIPSLFN